MLNIKERDIEIYAEKLNNEYSLAKPFPHVVIDDAIKLEFLNKVITEFPDLSKQIGRGVSHENDKRNNKLATGRGGGSILGKNSQELINYLNSSEFLDFTQKVTGIKEALIPDPHLIGGGYHEIKKGGFLKMHVDFSTHPETKLDRRLNLLLYLNKDWPQEYGGEFGMMDYKTRKISKKILPIFNRMVIFNTTDFTYHGHAEPLDIPTDKSRKSIALYYYSNGRPTSESKRNESNKYDTIFVSEKGEKMDIKYNLIKITKLLAPPILYKIKGLFRNQKN